MPRRSVLTPAERDALFAIPEHEGELIRRYTLRLYGQIGQALLEAKQSGGDACTAIESVMPWSEFAESVTDAQKFAQPEDFDFLRRIGESYATLRRYSPQLLNLLQLRAAPAANDVLDALNLLRRINTESERKVLDDAPTDFIKPRWLKARNDGRRNSRRHIRARRPSVPRV